MLLVWGNEVKAGVVMLVVVESNESLKPGPRCLKRGNAVAGIASAVLDGTKHQLHVGVVIRGPWE